MNSQGTNNPQILQNEPFEFRGSALDFFKIWFVNVILTIITLGIYGAWAKVRTNHYIYGNTYLGGHSFEYTANPIRILVGRLIIFGFYALYTIAFYLMFTEAAMLILALFILLLPLLIRQALVFRAKYTRFHGLSFRFRATIGQFYGFFLLHFLLNLVTIGIIFPYTHSEFKKLALNNASYGEGSFYFPGRAGQFFFVYYVKMLLLYVAFLVPIGILIAIMAASFEAMPIASTFLFIIMYFAAIVFSFVLQGSFTAWIGRIVYNDTSIKEYRMLNEWNAAKLSWIYFSNFIVMLFSLGLMYPWAKIRTVKYKLENMGFENLDLNAFVGQTEQNRSAVGEEVVDFFDFDIGF
ncbi:MAG: DUF898 domain-containing protein [Campylobacteraceae bacterium]|jgi:uncharacterized membrane protein YjgN (DUF898 family)|nr:DUF898 domain-containing protein [Campylobacteraceae bacterium]